MISGHIIIPRHANHVRHAATMTSDKPRIRNNEQRHSESESVSYSGLSWAQELWSARLQVIPHAGFLLTPAILLIIPNYSQFAKSFVLAEGPASIY